MWDPEDGMSHAEQVLALTADPIPVSATVHLQMHMMLGHVYVHVRSSSVLRGTRLGPKEKQGVFYCSVYKEMPIERNAFKPI